MLRLYSQEFPAGGRGLSTLQAMENASHCRGPSPAHQIQTGRQKEKGRVCLVEEGDSKEAEKGKEQTQGVAYTQHWSDGGWEELKNPITLGGGREYAKQWKPQEPDIQPAWCKGVWLYYRYHPVPLKRQWIGLLPPVFDCKEIYIKSVLFCMST